MVPTVHNVIARSSEEESWTDGRQHAEVAAVIGRSCQKEEEERAAYRQHQLGLGHVGHVGPHQSQG